MLYIVRCTDSFKVYLHGRLMIESKDLDQLEKLVEIFAAFEVHVFVYDDVGFDISDW